MVSHKCHNRLFRSGRLFTTPRHILHARNQQQYRPLVHGSAPPVMDAVTIVLAILAFFAVICLIPLYIFVAQAYLGG